MDDPYTDTPYAGSPEGWWTEYGGAVDKKSGVVYLPGPNKPPCTIPGCNNEHENRNTSE